VIGELRERWQARTPRERAVIGAAAAALAVAALWAYVWLPLAADRARLVEALPRLRAAAQTLAHQATEVDRLRAAARARGAAGAPQDAIEATLKASGLGDGYAGITPLGDGRVQVNLRAVPFDALAGAVAQLAEAHGLAVERIALKAAGEPGKVQVESLVLRAARGGGAQ
jgi:type II secretory pathway component PulM